MLTIQRNDYIAGGYVVTQPIRRPAHISGDLFPEILLSPTTCDNDMTLDVWGGETARQWRTYGVYPDRLAALLAWIDVQYAREIGMPNIFFSLATAQQFITDFFPPNTGWIILGLGLHRTLVDHVLTDEQRSEQEQHQSAWGKLDALADARQYADQAQRYDTYGVDVWVPWLIVRYP